MKRIIFSLLSIAMLVAMALPGGSPPAVQAAAGDWPDCSWNCNANDVVVNRMWLGDADGSELDTCKPGEPVTAYVWVEFENKTNSQRYAVILFGDLFINDVLDSPIDECVLEHIPKNAVTSANLTSINWTCGDEVELRNAYVVWKPSHETCADVTRDCSEYPPSKCFGPADLLVAAPLIADFEFDNVCFCTDTTFTDTTTGGVEPYTWDWDFGDSSGTSTEQNPSYHYDSAGTYNVTLTVTDDASPTPNIDSQSYNVTVHPTPTCNITATPGTEVCAGVNITLTEDGGDAESWEWSTNETTQSINVSASGNYSVTITDASNCTSSCNITVTVVEACEATAPDFSICEGTTVNNALFIANGASCSVGCSMTLDYDFDGSAAGNYTYNVTCDNGVCGPTTESGTVTVDPKPTADFSANVTSGCAPLNVVFTDASTGDPTSWDWSFPGGSPSSADTQGPHTVTYNGAGNYNVSLTVSNACGSDTETKTNYITVEDCGPVIVSVEQSSDTPCVGEDVVITAHVTDDVAVTSVNLTYDSTTVSMTLTGGNATDGYWTATILGQKLGTTLTIVVTASDGEHTVSTDPHDKTWIDCDIPVIASVEQSSDAPCDGEAVNITAHVTDDTGVISVNLTYNTTTVSMTLTGGTATDGFWTATIPGQPAGTTLTIVVTATDGEHTVSSMPHDKTWIDCAGALLTITKTGNPDPIGRGGTLTYSINVTNIGNATATNITIVDDYDETVLTITDSGGGTDNGDTITWNGGISVPAEGSFSRNVTATVRLTAPLGSIFLNTANVTCVEGSSDSVTISTRIPGIRPRPRGGGGGGGAPIKYLTVDNDEKITKKPLYSNDRLRQTLLGPNRDGTNSLLIEKGTLAPTADGERHYLITIRELDDIPPLPECTMAAVAVNITPAGAVFDEDIILTLGFNQLPENAISATMAYYDDVDGVWIPLESEPGEQEGVAELTISAALRHFSLFAVLVELDCSPPPSPPLPAYFVGSGLNIATSVERIWEPLTFVTKTGESATITASIANDGGQEGSYNVELKINGETVETRVVTLGVGQSEQVSFTLSGMDYGQYEVEVAGLSGAFTVSRTIDWWLIIIIIIAIGLISWGVVWGRRRRRAAQQG